MKKILFPVLLFFASISAAAEMAPRIAEVKVFNGKPTLFVDHQPVSPDFYALTHAYGARWTWEEVPQRNLKNFYDIGFRLFQLDLYLEDIWREGTKARRRSISTRPVIKYGGCSTSVRTLRS